MIEMPLTIFVVDDDAAVRDSLRWLIESTGMTVATYSSAEEFLADFDGHRPGCLVLDARLPGLDGLALQERLRERQIDLPIIIITGHADVPMAIQALKAGAVDFIEKPFDDDTLLNSIRLATREAADLRLRTARRNEAAARVQQLTPREHQVLELVAAGCSTKEVACKLRVTQKTVETHRANARHKMQTDTSADFIRAALLAGLCMEPSAEMTTCAAAPRGQRNHRPRPIPGAAYPLPGRFMAADEVSGSPGAAGRAEGVYSP